MGYKNEIAKSYYRKRFINLIMSNYWERRKNNDYYKLVKAICSKILINNKNYSIIDFGCRNTEIIFDLKCDKKFLLDKKDEYKPYQKLKIAEKNIIFIEKSIYDIDYTNEFDICICLQTLEHLEDPEKAFRLIHKASKLYTIISLPYKWEVFAKGHIHHHIDEQLIKKWTKLDPIQSYVMKDRGSERIINVYTKN
jgi:2-polyprenyl-3-methyl-5-hydroxy-6-metoxy-1,4-benzoquinol methylase